MKAPSHRLTLALLALSAGFVVSVPSLRAADDKPAPKADKKAEQKAKHDAAMLQKYDKNGNGKLDPDEEAAMKADQDKARAERKKAKHDKN